MENAVGSTKEGRKIDTCFPDVRNEKYPDSAARILLSKKVLMEMFD
jgi:hypothetical protein